jgi:hypothetical protein
MTRRLRQLGAKLAEFDVFVRLGEQRFEELADAIYMSGIRSRIAWPNLLDAIRGNVLDDAFFEEEEGNVFHFVNRRYVPFAKELFKRKAGGGTPAASVGKGELLLLSLSPNTDKPRSGDIRYGESEIEIKANGGRLGVGVGMDANKKVVAFCQRQGIELEPGKLGKQAKGQLAFNPLLKKDVESVGNRFGEVLKVWWEAISGDELTVQPTWNKVRRKFLEKVADTQMKKADTLLVLDDEGRFRFFRASKDFVKFYNHSDARFEYRPHQRNAFSVYLNL